MYRFQALFLLTHLAIATEAQNFTGQYTGLYQNEPVILVLIASGPYGYTGDLNDSHNTYKVSATAQGNTLKGQCTAADLGIALEMQAVLQDSKLSMELNLLGNNLSIELQKSGNPTTTTGTEAQQATGDLQQRDPMLVGRWTQQSNYNSGYGQGSMSSESSMIFLADGQLADGGSRTVVSGTDWSGNSAAEGKGIIPGLRWYTAQQKLYLQVTENGKTTTQLLGRYYIESNSLLITGQDGTKLLYYRG